MCAEWSMDLFSGVVQQVEKKNQVPQQDAVPPSGIIYVNLHVLYFFVQLYGCKFVCMYSYIEIQIDRGT